MLRRVAGNAHNMTENALSILVVIFPYNSSKLRPQTESCLFSNQAGTQHGNISESGEVSSDIGNCGVGITP